MLSTSRISPANSKGDLYEVEIECGFGGEWDAAPGGWWVLDFGKCFFLHAEYWEPFGRDFPGLLVNREDEGRGRGMGIREEPKRFSLGPGEFRSVAETTLRARAGGAYHFGEDDHAQIQLGGHLIGGGRSKGKRVPET